MYYPKPQNIRESVGNHKDISESVASHKKDPCIRGGFVGVNGSRFMKLRHSQKPVYTELGL
jgi:hypothetical protein